MSYYVQNRINPTVFCRCTILHRECRIAQDESDWLNEIQTSQRNYDDTARRHSQQTQLFALIALKKNGKKISFLVISQSDVCISLFTVWRKKNSHCRKHDLITAFCLYSVHATQLSFAINSLQICLIMISRHGGRKYILPKKKNIKQMEMNIVHMW